MLSDVIELTSQVCSDKTVKVTLDTEKTSVEIRYTLDGLEPCENSTLYTRPFILTKETTVKAALFKDGKNVGIPLYKVVGISEDIQNYYEYINEAI